MNGEIPSIPITTLAGVSSLTDLLPQLPLPTPLPQTVNNKSLLFSPKISEDAHKLLSVADEGLAQQLLHALRQASTSHIELQDNLATESLEGELPQLLKSILRKDPNVFRTRSYDAGVQLQHPPQSSLRSQGPQHAAGSHPSSPHVYQQNTSLRYQMSPSPLMPNQSSSYGQLGSPFAATSAGIPAHSSQHRPNHQHFNTVNGDCYTEDGMMGNYGPMLHSVHQQKKLPVSSPAQATSAEGVVQQHVPHQPSPSYQSGEEVRLRFAKRRPSTGRQSDSAFSSPLDRHNPASRIGDTMGVMGRDSILQNPVVGTSPRVCEPRVILKDIMPVGRLGHADVGSMSQNKKKSTGPVVLLEPLDSETLKSIATGGTVKAVCDNESRKRKRSREDPGYSIMRSDDGNMSFQVSRSRRVDKGRGAKKKHLHMEESDDESSEYIEMEEDEEAVMARKRKKEKQRQKRTMVSILSNDELMESPTFKKFTSCMDYVFDTAEEANLAAMDINDEDTECPPEMLVAKGVLGDVCGESAKLKSMNVMNQIPPDKLVRLMTILSWNIKDGTKVTPFINQEEDEEESKLWRELTMERVIRSMDASLTCTSIMTSPFMHKMVYLEDVIERIIIYGKFQLQNTIYPEFDPVYRVDPSAKDGYHGSLKAKRARASSVKHKSTITLYNKMCELVSGLAELLVIQEMTDTIILQVSSLGVSAFFVENISELQLSAMKLVTTVFSQYDKHRQLILEDIFASLARLPSSKRNLRNYRLNAEESIQMVTALALQLIQCVVKLPGQDDSRPPSPSEDGRDSNKQPKPCGDSDVLIVTSYETAMRTAYNFLTVFLKKCTAKGEEDYRPLFENFVQDLLSTVNKPEWPASELLLSLLGRILVQQFSSKATDTSLRVASLEYLGIVAARLRKDAVTSHLSQDAIDEIVQKVNESSDEEDPAVRRAKRIQIPSADTTQSLQESILEYLAYNGQSDPALQFARQFYIAQWYRDTTVEAEKKIKAHHNTSGSDEEDFNETEAEKTTEVMQNVEKRKSFLLSQIASSHSALSSIRPSPSKLDYERACLVARYLSSKRPFAQSFDIYLTQILKVLSETAVAVRTKAMKCLAAVVEADPGILARNDMQRGVHGRFLDQSTSVREAAVELVGKFILIRPELIPQYYDMLSERILDTGISVRKRVIKIFKDICIEHPDFDKIPEMCVKMIRRVNDEEGIKKLVNEVFQTMWFSPVSTRDRDSSKLLQKVMNITDVVAASKDTGHEFFEQLLENLLKKDEDGNYNKSAILACTQIVDCLVENVLRIEEKGAEMSEGRSTSSRLVACFSTLYLFSKIKPDIMVKHATTLQPYLDIKCSIQSDYLVLHYVARILELVVPLMEHPSEIFLMTLEEDMIKLILKHGMMVLQSCVSCLGAVVNKVSHNYALVKDCFQKFFGVLSKLMADHKQDSANQTLKARRPTLMRSLFTVGQLCRHFDFDSKEMGETKVCVRQKVFDVLFYFIHHEEEEVQHKALTALGFFLCRHFDYMLQTLVKTMYHDCLTNDSAPVKLRCQVLKNLQLYLIEEEVQMAKADADWKKHAKEEDLKEMGDIQSGMASTVVQLYLKEVLEAYFHEHPQVRITALNVVQLILRQGLVHPVQCMPYLICMSTDPENMIRVKADQQLGEIEKKYPGFTHMKALQGIKNSYKLHQVLHKNNPTEPIRGFRQSDEGQFQAQNGFLYGVLRSNRSHRRGLLTSLLNLFDDTGLQRISLGEQVYVADNLAFFPYQVQDEPLFIIHQIDIIVSVAGSNLMQSFKENLSPLHTGEQNGEQPQQDLEIRRKAVDDDDDDIAECLLNRLPDDISPLQDIMQQSQGCILLLMLKQHLKDMYGITDGKIHRYSPTEAAKAFDKPLNRKNQLRFHPQHTIDLLRSVYDTDPEEDEKRQKLVDEYLEFRDLMMSIDPTDEDDSGDERSTGRATPAHSGHRSPADAEAGGEGDTVDGIQITERPSGDGDLVEKTTIFTPRTPKLYSEKKRRNYHHSSSNRIPKMNIISSTMPSSKNLSVKKKRKRRKRTDESGDEDSDDDPDFVL
ncbi:nipped-B-like protein B isoform X1 [Pomacea canaliculata]|uniref:nipped-B-like protein B isoform X1 n=1 Tax=Pomacea canaliculata TaxID=400727 RepID=UPI000D73B7B5|nr:nipped-B-like protein B isoform X1 [Pomacea canaliculata]